MIGSHNTFAFRALVPTTANNNAGSVIIDFGFAKYVPAPSQTFTLCGTPLYRKCFNSMMPHLSLLLWLTLSLFLLYVRRSVFIACLKWHTPVAVPPEVILNRGHNGAADYWSLGVLIFEMLTGNTPFYQRGMEQTDLFRAIVKCRYTVPSKLSESAPSVIRALLVKNPAQRLGSLAGGESGLTQHPWLATSIDFAALRQKTMKAPKVPTIADPLDASNFEDWSHLEDKTKKKFPKMTKAQLAVFNDF